MTTYKGYFKCCGFLQSASIKELEANKEIACKKCFRRISEKEKTNIKSQINLIKDKKDFGFKKRVVRSL